MLLLFRTMVVVPKSAEGFKFMARDLRPKNKKARRAGIDLGLTTSTTKLQRRLNIPPGQHGRKRQKKVSAYGEQLAEKQKLKLMYGVLERQFVGYYKQAAKDKHATGSILIRLLETRLDNTLYRLNLASTRSAARQLITHGHVFVNNKKVSIPSYQVIPGQIMTLSTKALNTPQIKVLLAQKDINIPAWLKRKAAVGKVERLPKREDITIEINEKLIVEYYSR